MNDCARRLYQEKVLGHVDLAADWAGWRLRGKWLISPDGQRLNPERLRGILFREDGEKRLARAVRSNTLASALIVPWQGKSRLPGVASDPDEEPPTDPAPCAMTAGG